MDLNAELAKLKTMFDKGAISSSEYEQAKTRLFMTPLRTSNTSSPSFGRSTTDKVLGGVCAGLANYTQTPTWVWRLGFASAAVFFGTGFLAYLLLWIFVPKQS